VEKMLIPILLSHGSPCSGKPAEWRMSVRASLHR